MLFRNKVVTFFCSFSLLLSGCAPNSASLAPAYVSPLVYANFDCEQMQMEYARLSRRAYEASGQQDQAASDDAAMFAIGMILFWPALFFLGGTKEQEAEYARLKGEYEALDRVAVQKNCIVY